MLAFENRKVLAFLRGFGRRDAARGRQSVAIAAVGRARARRVRGRSSRGAVRQRRVSRDREAAVPSDARRSRRACGSRLARNPSGPSRARSRPRARGFRK